MSMHVQPEIMVSDCPSELRDRGHFLFTLNFSLKLNIQVLLMGTAKVRL